MVVYIEKELVAKINPNNTSKSYDLAGTHRLS